MKRVFKQISFWIFALGSVLVILSNFSIIFFKQWELLLRNFLMLIWGGLSGIILAALYLIYREWVKKPKDNE
jgi:hypothetical protein